jgi:hypothetical protein
MNYILLVIATNAYLGTYGSQSACELAIREQLSARTIAPAVLKQFPKDQIELYEKHILDPLYKIQTDYQCVAQEKK